MSKENNDKAARARNKTVMLTPDIANQMRSRLMTGTHRSGSTEKLDTGLINQVRENFGAPQTRERDTEDKQTQIIDSSRFMNQLPAIEEETELEVNFLDALKSRETPRSPETRNAPVVQIDKLDFDVDEPEVILAPVEQRSIIEEDFVALENLDDDFTEDLMSVKQTRISPEPESYRIEIPENNFEEEIKMNQTVGSLNTDLKRGIPSSPVKQAGVSESQCLNGDIIKWEKETPLVGFLVSFDGNPKGDFVILRNGRLIVSADQSDKGNLLVINDESVSPMHAIIRVSESSIVVLDQLSENGTKIQKADGATIELSGDKANLEHGDTLSFGDRNYKVCVLF